jgi:hydrogenase small subunit
MGDSISEIDILWITAGLGCDGDTIAMTAATQPSLEDMVFGGLPGIPIYPGFDEQGAAVENDEGRP